MDSKKDEIYVLHHKLAVDYFNKTWDLMDLPIRSKDQNIEMIHTAHASLFHWLQIGEPIHFARGEWQISRVYNLVKLGDSALLHGEKSLELCLANGIGDFDLTFAYETIARAYNTLHMPHMQKKFYTLALDSTEKIKKSEDKNYALNELKDLEIV